MLYYHAFIIIISSSVRIIIIVFVINIMIFILVIFTIFVIVSLSLSSVLPLIYLSPCSTASFIRHYFITSQLSAALLVLAASSSPAAARSLDAAPSSASSGSHSLSKRSLFDPACTGIYDRQLLGKLGRLCDDCYNVFREPKVATGCRWAWALGSRS